jgi:hypothetical protein
VGRNLALPNSFFLQFTNNSSSRQIFNLFNIGGSNQTPITNQQNLSTILNNDISAFIDNNGNLLADTTFEILDSSFVLLATTSLLTGQNISLVASGLNPITGTNGLSGNFQISQLQVPNQTSVNVSVGSANAGLFRIFQTSAPFATQITSFQQNITTFVTANPLVTLGGTIPYQEIENSETGNAYKILAMDVISNKANQLLQNIQYGRRFANGNRHLLNINPIIDPYQNTASIQSVDSQGFTIDSNALFLYAIEGFTFARLTFNYVRAQVSIMEEFDQAFVQQLTMESEKLEKILNLDSEERLNYLLFQ